MRVYTIRELGDRRRFYVRIWPNCSRGANLHVHIGRMHWTVVFAR